MSRNLNHDTLLSFVKVSSLVTDTANKFFSQYKTNDIEFNILMTLKDFDEGLSQTELGTKLVIKKSNLVSIIDKLENKKFVKRKTDNKDRRINLVYLTPKGKEFITKVEPSYFREVDSLINKLNNKEKEKLIELMFKLEGYFC